MKFIKERNNLLKLRQFTEAKLTKHHLESDEILQNRPDQNACQNSRHMSQDEWILGFCL